MSTNDLISIKDRLPDNDDPVLVLGLFRWDFREWSPLFTIGWYRHKYNKWVTDLSDDDACECLCILFWAPLPTIPDIDISKYASLRGHDKCE
jgi:hypothetical protein